MSEPKAYEYMDGLRADECSAYNSLKSGIFLCSTFLVYPRSTVRCETHLTNSMKRELFKILIESLSG